MMIDKPTVRVAHYMTGYPACDGSSAFCRGLSRAMNRLERGSCPIITCRPGAAEKAHEDEELLQYEWGTRNPFRVPKGLVEDLESNKHDLDGIVLHGTYNPHNASLARHLRKLNIPYLFLPHDPYPPALRRHHCVRKKIFWHLFEKPLIRSARVLQLLDSSHERYFKELGIKGPFMVMPNGCEAETLKYLGSEIREPGKETPVRIIFLGRMDRNHKGLDLLLEGFALFLERTDEDVRLILGGNDWHDRPFLEKFAAKLGLGERVEFVGRRQEESIQVHAESDLTVLASRFDGFGITIVEAMLAARPVLVSSAAGVASHVEAAGGGWLMNPDPKSICEGLIIAFSHRDEWPKRGLLNRDYILENLTWDRLAEEAIQQYRKWFK